MKLEEILRTAAENDASDIHIVPGHPPVMRVHTVMTPMDFPVLTPETAHEMFKEIANDGAKKIFNEHQDADFSFALEGLGRYRVNAHKQRNATAMALRIVKSKVPPLAQLNLPEVIARLTYLPRGLVLVTGDTGSGKSTSLAAMIQAMNERYRKHIITLEDPVEYTFESNRCLIEQRELGQDMPTFSSGL
ncbi:MAG: type IV pilus twitching motility protein PilT, partial [Planctomycetota bacterium]